MTDRATWLEERRTGIGGSDVAAVLGISPWKSRYALWAEKVGLLAADEEEAEHLEAGRRMEPVIGHWYGEETNRLVWGPGEMKRHPDRQYLIANVDRWTTRTGEEAFTGILECKNVDAFKGKEWLEAAPLHYQVQLQHYFAVTGYTWGSFAVLIGGNKFRWYDVQRDDDFINNALLPACEAFWRRVQSGEPPEPDASESTNAALGRVWAQGNEEAIEIPMPMADELLTEYLAARTEAATAEKRVLQAENLVRFAMKDATYGVVAGRGRWSLKAAKGKTKRTLRWSEEGQ